MADGTTRTHELVAEHGWTAIAVLADEVGPGFAYSVGLFRTFDHPEVLVSGLSIETGQAVVNTVGALVREGAAFADGDVSKDVLEGRSCCFKRLAACHYEAYLGQAIAFYGHDGFPALQCVWPDSVGMFPWEQGAAEGLAEKQERLYATGAV